MMLPHQRFRIPRRGIDWALRPAYLRRTFKPYSSASLAVALAAAGFGTTATLLYFATPVRQNDAPRPDTQFTAFLPSSFPAFDPFAKKTLSLITHEQAESFLHANQRSLNWRTPASAVLRHDFNSVASNYPCEDDASYAYVGGRHYFTVFDGHSGWEVSRYLAENLIGRVAAELSDPSLKTDADVHAAIKRVFLQVDDELVSTPIPLVKEYEAAGVKEPYDLPIATRFRHRRAWELATSGSCALMAICDAARDRLHVAVTGDSRAVMGVWDAEHGVWRARQLSDDLTSANPKEAKRLQALHPPEEAEDLVRNGRTLGLGVSRAFGDARFKWSLEDLKNISTSIIGRVTKPYPNYKTPPYVTAEPELVSVPLSPPSGRGFVVLASDGVYDRLTNIEVVALVGGWLDGVQGTHSREDVRKLATLGDHPEGTYFAKSYYIDEAEHPPSWKFTFQDANAATHVIRNGLAGDDKEELRLQYSFSDSRSSRDERDDMTVTVIFLGTQPTSAASTTPRRQAN
ncbi:protein serine/threonine phosphatase 2C [Exidia glandulosa HHB12029]|uniref:Protein serine/threonine phosphatase 2C n=1 Tax=Exidia glandulosa HHB12029 TaxID=1314781 RepID=A0A165J9Z0_EXIGL|nr:protein serine/threonine phosphatase 2C [Exidia glandulosa HHB12029]